MPNRLAISVGVTPASLSRVISSVLRRAVGARPLYFPSRWALAIPSRCLLPIRVSVFSQNPINARPTNFEPHGNFARRDTGFLEPNDLVCPSSDGWRTPFVFAFPLSLRFSYPNEQFDGYFRNLVLGGGLPD